MAELITRSQWGAAPPRGSAVPFNASEVKGLAVHYTDWPYDFSSHANCAANLRTLQANAFSRNYRDIEYNFLVCSHGYIFQGRGLHDMGGANGVTPGDYANLEYVSVSFMSDGKLSVTPAVADALRQVRGYVTTAFPHATEVWPHQHFVATACPSQPVLDWLATNPFSSQEDVMTDAQMAEIKKFIEDVAVCLAFYLTTGTLNANTKEYGFDPANASLSARAQSNIAAAIAAAKAATGSADPNAIAKAVLDAEAARLQS